MMSDDGCWFLVFIASNQFGVTPLRVICCFSPLFSPFSDAGGDEKWSRDHFELHVMGFLDFDPKSHFPYILLLILIDEGGWVFQLKMKVDGCFENWFSKIDEDEEISKIDLGIKKN